MFIFEKYFGRNSRRKKNSGRAYRRHRRDKNVYSNIIKIDCAAFFRPVTFASGILIDVP